MSGPGTFIVFCFTALALAVVGALFHLMRKWRWRRLVVTPLLFAVTALAVAPFVEEKVIASTFEEKCRDAGIHVMRKVEAAGFYDTTMQSGYEYINRLGYTFIEHPASSNRGKVEHLRKVGNEWNRTIFERPSARYHLVESRSNEAVGHKVRVLEQAIIDSETKEIIARSTIYKRVANTVDQAWMGLLGSTLKLCPDPAKGPARPGLVDQTITPRKR